MIEVALGIALFFLGLFVLCGLLALLGQLLHWFYDLGDRLDAWIDISTRARGRFQWTHALLIFILAFSIWALALS